MIGIVLAEFKTEHHNMVLDEDEAFKFNIYNNPNKDFKTALLHNNPINPIREFLSKRNI